MSVQANISAVAGNDLLPEFSITLNGTPLNLAGYAIVAHLKASATTPDDDGLQFTIGDGLTLVSPSQFTWSIPHTDTVPAGQMWYRVDLQDGSNIVTAMYGNLTLVAA
jgi:hypothetical protein